MSSAHAGSSGSVTYAPFAGENIPTLSGWMLILLSLLLMVVAFRSAKNKHSGANKLFMTLLGVSLLSFGTGTVHITENLIAAAAPELSEPSGGVADVFDNYENNLENTSGVNQKITNVDVSSLQCDSYAGNGSVAGECVAGLIVTAGNSCAIDCTNIPTTGSIVLTKAVTQGNPNEPNQLFLIGATNGDYNLGTAFKDGDSNSHLNLNPDTYTISEQSLPDDWSLENIVCTSTTGGSSLNSFTAGDTTQDIGLVAGDIVNCTFTNSYVPPLAVATCTLGTTYQNTVEPNHKFRWNLSIDSGIDDIADSSGGSIYIDGTVYSANASIKTVASINPILNLQTTRYSYPVTLRVDLKDDLSRVIGTCSTELTIPAQVD